MLKKLIARIVLFLRTIVRVRCILRKIVYRYEKNKTISIYH